MSVTSTRLTYTDIYLLDSHIPNRITYVSTRLTYIYSHISVTSTRRTCTHICLHDSHIHTYIYLLDSQISTHILV